MADKSKTPRATQVTWASVALALVTSLSGNGYFALQASDAQQALESKEEARVEAIKDLATLQVRHEGLQTRFEEHVRMREAADKIVIEGQQRTAQNLFDVNKTLIEVVAKLP
tara:strand:- start:534 stop:869 length:336 start_codon:yes stop_codon:yes gene_type:complete